MSIRREKFIAHRHEIVAPLEPGSTIFRSLRRAETIATLGSATVAKVRGDPGYQVTSFRDLAHCVAQIGSKNTRFNLLFRGQSQDYKDRNHRTKLYATIFRAPPGGSRLSTARLQKRFESLRNFVEALIENRDQLELNSPLAVHPQYWVALLQHYGVCPTPLLDITQSLRAAATFALTSVKSGSVRPRGYLYVLGLPHPMGSISTYADDDLLLVKLQNVCPPHALRPHFQEGYLAGRWPGTKRKEAGDNLAYWLVGKYRLDNRSDRFFDDDFTAVPRNALLPSDDPFKDSLTTIIKQLNIESVD